ncbi:hypothetical protein tb265_48090 [Gemmatimonadetes bacterium T265]|nr:hypothetical protein tb265_48090 [Gemmatimonadetes bacterium T265]
MPPHWLTVLSWVSLGAAALSPVAILADNYVFGHRQRMRVMEAVWPVTALYFGPVAVWAYYRWARAAAPHTGMHGDHPPHANAGRAKMAMPMASLDRPFW